METFMRIYKLSLLIFACTLTINCATSAEEIIRRAQADNQTTNRVSFSDETDRFTGIRTVAARSENIKSDGRRANFGFNVTTRAKVSPRGATTYLLVVEYAFTFVSSAPSDMIPFIDCGESLWIVNGRTLRKQNQFYRTMDQREFYNATYPRVEFVDVKFSRSELDAMAESQEVPYRICGKDGSLTGPELTGLKNVLASVM